MEFGIQVANLEFAQLRAISQMAEELGFKTILVPDHIVAEGPERQFDPHFLAYDSMTAVAAIAEATKTVRVGHLVLCNLFRHPAITAQSLMSLDQLSGGRLIAGLGTGWTEREFMMTGIPFPDIGTRLRMLDEALTCIHSLWTNEETTFSGEFYQLRDAILWPKPVQKPHPPILLGGGGKGLLRIAAKHADIVNIIIDTGKPGYIRLQNIAELTNEAFRARGEFLRDEARRLGRDPQAIQLSNAIFNLMLTDSPAASESTAAGMAGMFNTTTDGIRQTPLALIGTHEECIAELQRRHREWGVTQFLFSNPSEDALRRLGEHVIPYV